MVESGHMKEIDGWVLFLCIIIVMVLMLCRGDAEACRTLLDLGADINGNLKGLTAVMAATIGVPSFKTMKVLVSDPNVKLDIEVPCMQSFIAHVFSMC